MIAARHKKWADWIFRHYLNGLFKRHFYAIRLLDPVPDFDPRKPVLLLPNHSSWWDGFFVYLLNKKCFHRKIYLMMLEEQLKLNRFFRFLGVYSIQPDSFSDVKQSLRYTMDILNNTEKPSAVCFFPQGELLPWHTRPIHLKKGLAYILKRIENEIDLCFLSIRIEFLQEQRPEVFLQLSNLETMRPDRSFSIEDLQSKFNAFLDRLEKQIIEGEKSKILFQGKQSVNQRFHSFRQ